MKNLFFISFLLFSLNSFSQVNAHAIGLRGGMDNHGNGTEVTYQHGLGESNRLELDLGWWGNNGWGNNDHLIAFSGIYHWVWNLDQGLNWYAGFGAQIGHYRKYHNDPDKDIDYTFIGLGGQIGIEYDFSVHDVPLLLSIDARPMFGSRNYQNYGGALSIRYVFD